MLKYIYFSNKIYKRILSNSYRKLLWFEITKMLIAVYEKKLLCHLLQFSAHTRSVVPHLLPVNYYLLSNSSLFVAYIFLFFILCCSSKQQSQALAIHTSWTVRLQSADHM